MADTDNPKDTKDYFLDIPVKGPRSNVRGANALDWGMQNRLSRIFQPESGKTVMLAVDHGYFQGPTAGLERVDVTIVPLLQNADALMCTRGILRSTIPSSLQSGVVLRASGGRAFSKNCQTNTLRLTWTTRHASTSRPSLSRCTSAGSSSRSLSTT